MYYGSSKKAPPIRVGIGGALPYTKRRLRMGSGAAF